MSLMQASLSGKYNPLANLRIEQLYGVLDAAPVGISITTDPTCTTIIHNPEAAKFLRIEPWESLSLSLEKRYLPLKLYHKGVEMLPEDMPIQRAMWFGECINEMEIEFVWDDGVHKLSTWNSNPFLDNAGNIIGAVATWQETTERNNLLLEAQERLGKLLQAEQEKNEALAEAIKMKDDFLALVSHEFRTPLTVINSAVQLIELSSKKDLSEKCAKYLKLIKQNTFRQMRLVNNLLGISHIKAGQFKVHQRNIDIVFLTKAIVESVLIYAQEKGLHLTFKTKLKKAIIAVDDEIFERILLNLLSNAIKFTPAEKSIAIELSTRKGYVCLTVKDEGVGIPQDKLEFIFERFGQVNSLLTRKAEGTGLGLTLVKMLVNALGGDIFVDSEVGLGSAFNVILPAKKAAETGETQEAKNTLSSSRFMQATAIEFSDIYL